MPAPFMIVTFIDADGDEFPVRVQGTYTTAQRPALLVEARRLLEEFESRGELRPTYPLEPKARVELV